MSNQSSRQSKLRYLNRYRKTLTENADLKNIKHVRDYLNNLTPNGSYVSFGSLSDSDLDKAYSRAKANHISKRKGGGLIYDKYRANASKYEDKFSSNLDNQRSSNYFKSDSHDLYRQKQEFATTAKRNYNRRVKEILKEADLSSKERKKINKQLNKLRNMSNDKFSQWIKEVDGKLGFSELFFDSEDKYILGSFYDKSDYQAEYTNTAKLLSKELGRL